ncbi:hypothetical protein DNTS_001782 [Danionella cerebrum]|uniref:rRNA methyltransferase 2, mitochondrial n=1 Tax=Danionella cerebrum TaxID=2873325 RepID=A0A553MNQ8_9TELE|nr:hypothetical protein DNTS_001782 [Danionella translucida]
MMWGRVQNSWLHVSARSLKKSPQNLKGKSVTEQRWLERQLNDQFVKAAHLHNYRCRSAFKLLEIDDRYKVLKPGFTVIDCGAAPGAWSQVAVQRVNSAGQDPALPKGRVIGIDLLHISPLEGAEFLAMHDITMASTLTALEKLLSGAQAHAFLSDMAPNATGFRELDHERLVSMCLSMLDMADRLLKPGGSLICKCWDGALANKLQQKLSTLFKDVRKVKPKASRKESSELFFLARMFKT